MSIDDFNRMQAFLLMDKFQKLLEAIELLDPQGTLIGACLHTKRGRYSLIHDTASSGPRLMIRVVDTLDGNMSEEFEVSFRRKVGAPPYVASE